MRKHRNLFVEGLENRAMLAGNVTVAVSGGSLVITGDIAGNGVSVQQLDNGKYFVTGFSVSGGNTTVNGSLAGKVVTGVTNDINVDLDGGNDVFVMSNRASRRAELAAQLSGGTAGPIQPSPQAPSSNVDPGLTRVPKNLSVATEDGADGVGMTVRVGSNDLNGGAHVGGVANLKTGSGDDRVIVKNSTIFDDLLIDTAAGADNVDTSGSGTYDFLYATLGQGWDTFTSTNSWGYHSQIYGGNGNDTISVSNYNFTEEVFLHGGEGDNTITANNMNAGHVSVWGLAGRDTVELTNCSSRANFLIDVGENDDDVDLDDVDVANTLSVYMGGGNDDLEVANSQTGDTFFDGGAGAHDNYDDNGGNTLGSPTIVNFES